MHECLLDAAEFAATYGYTDIEQLVLATARVVLAPTPEVQEGAATAAAATAASPVAPDRRSTAGGSGSSRAAAVSGAAAVAAAAPAAAAERPRRQCANCGATSGGGVKLKNCAGCRSIWFCSNQCQTAAWPRHKLVCARVDREP